MRNFIRAAVLACLATLPMKAVYAEPYAGVNVGANFVTINKDLNYMVTQTSMSDKYSGLRLQLVLGYNIRAFARQVLSEPNYTDNGDYSTSTRSNYDENNPDSNVSIAGSSDEDFYVALELNAAYNTNNASANISPWFLTNNAAVREELQFSGDLFALAKYRPVSRVIVFLGPGVSQGFFKITSPAPTAGNLGVTGTFSTTLTGWSVKGGVEITMSKEANLVLGCQYSSYNDVRWSAAEPLTGETVSAKYKPAIISVTIGANMF